MQHGLVRLKPVAQLVVSNQDWKEKNAQFEHAHFEGGKPWNWKGASRIRNKSIRNPLCTRTLQMSLLPRLVPDLRFLSLVITDTVSSSPQHYKPPHHLCEGIMICWWIEPLSFYAALLQWNLLTNTESVRKIFMRPLASNPTFHLPSLNLQIWSTYTHFVKYENNAHIYVLYKDSSIYG